MQESDGACALPVKILCKDETGQLIDISEHLIKKGLAFRNKRFGYFFYSFRPLYSQGGKLISKTKIWIVLYSVYSNRTPSLVNLFEYSIINRMHYTFQISKLLDAINSILTSICHLCFFTSMILFFCTTQVLYQLMY